MSKNYIIITVTDTGIRFEPDCPDVVAAFETLKVSVRWETKRWSQVKVFEFCYKGHPAPTKPKELVFNVCDGQVVEEIGFRHPVRENCFGKYCVELVSDSESFTIDPTVLMKKPGN